MANIKNKKRGSKSIIFIFIILIWNLVGTIDRLINYKTSLDYNLWNSLGMSNMFFTVGIITILFILTSGWILIRPNYTGYKIILTGLFLAVCEYLFFIFVSIKNYSTVLDFYITSRKARGLPLSDKQIEFFSSSYGLPIIIGVSIIFIFVIIYLIYRNKNYFKNP